MANSIVCLNMSVFEISPNKDIVHITLYVHVHVHVHVCTTPASIVCGRTILGNHTPLLPTFCTRLPQTLFMI